jgi:hypothetical protein
MKKWFPLLIAMFLICTDILYAETLGDTWNRMTQDHKVIFLSGYLTGNYEMFLGLKNYLPKEEYDKLFKELREIGSIQGTTQQLVEGVNYYYGKLENANLTIFPLVRATIAKMKGATEQEIDTYLASIRRKFLKANEEKNKEFSGNNN